MDTKKIVQQLRDLAQILRGQPSQPFVFGPINGRSWAADDLERSADELAQLRSTVH